MSEITKEPAKDVFLVFAGFIDQIAVQKFFVMTTGVIQNGGRKVHIIIQTTGGSVSDGICLYNYFRSLPLEVIAYNVGSVSSAGVLAYLGAQKRVVAPLATFMIHRTHATLQGANVDMVQARVASLIMDDARSEAVLKEHIKLTPDQWTTHGANDLWLTAEDAVSSGLATETGHFGPPLGSLVFNVLG